MSFEAVNWAWKQRYLSVHEKMVLLALANRHNPDYGCYPSIRKIVEDVEFSRSTVIRAIKNLQAFKLIAVQEAKRENGSQTSNRYILAFEGCQPDTTPCVTETLPPVSQRHSHKQVIYKQVNSNKELDLNVFDDVWNLYPRKQAKGAAKSSWIKACKKISPHDLERKLKDYILAAQGSDPKFIPMLSTWLNQERWEDEFAVGEKEKTSTDFLDSLFQGGVLGIENK